MKVLWVVNHSLPILSSYLDKKPNTSGSWLVELESLLKKESDIDLHIISPGNKNIEVVIDSASYHQMKMTKFDKNFCSTFRLNRRVNKFLYDLKPDIIHIHGSEFPFIIPFLKTKTPTVIQIQGLISEINKFDIFFASMENRRISYFNPKKLNYYSFTILKYLRNKFRVVGEIKALKIVKSVIGRTEWDKKHCLEINEKLEYYPIQEIMRKPFYYSIWSIDKSSVNTIFCPTGFMNPLKGFHKVVETLDLVKKEFPDIILRVPGRNILTMEKNKGYFLFIKDKICQLGLQKNIVFLGTLDEEEMKAEYLKSRLVVIGSSIENSSNSMGEALLLGCPTIAPRTGGLTSLAFDKSETLFYQFGDSVDLSKKIMFLLKNDNISVSMGQQARKRAVVQYDMFKIFSKTLKVYDKILLQTKGLNGGEEE